MKKIKKMLKFILILLTVATFIIFFSGYVFIFFWKFDILKEASYIKLQNFWNNGGVFRTFKDISLLVCLMLLPISIIISTKKLYKEGFWKTILTPFVMLWKKATNPKREEIQSVTIKNLGAKDKTLDDIINEKMKEKLKEETKNTIQDIRNQISTKIKENETQ